MRRLAGRLRAWWRVLVRSRALERDMRDEMRFHVDMEAERLQQAHDLPPAEARRRALVRFGGVEATKEAGRDARGRQLLDAVSIDARLGVRMLWKYRGLTLTGGFAMAAAVTIGAVAFEIIGRLMTPTLPFDPGGRIVAVTFEGPDEQVQRLALARGDVAVESFESIGAYRTVQLNLASSNAPPETIAVARMTSSGFAMARVSPALGRYLQPQDDSPAAPPVIVIGHRAWQTRFSSDPGLVGRVLTLSGVAHEVVGVMPEGFGFPVDHDFWIPLRFSAGSPAPDVYVFARLAEDATVARAEAEVQAVAGALRTTTGTQEEPSVRPYTLDHVDFWEPEMKQLARGLQLSTSLLVFVVAINLATILYARTVRRVGEIAVRTALGASRRRVLIQLFFEALALTATGAAAGLVAAALTLNHLQESARSLIGSIPFWIQFRLSTATVIEVGVLAVLAALIMGVVPGLRATGRHVHVHLHEIRGGQGPRLGRVWATLVVAQIAAAVAILPAAVYMAWEVSKMHASAFGFATERYSFVQMRVPAEDGPLDAVRIRDQQQQVMTRLAAEPGVEAVTFSSSVPGMGPGAVLEFDRSVRTTTAPWIVSRFQISPDLFDVYDAQLLAGRVLQPADIGTDNVVVNETFVGWLENRGDAVGVRFRYTSWAGTPIVNGRWHQIVGIVADVPRVSSRLALDTPAAVYHAATLGSINPIAVTLRYAGGAPRVLERRAREIAAEVDPALQVVRAMTLPDFYWRFYQLWAYLSWAINLVTASALVLSAAGLYAMMAFIVAQRQREIGLRIALGASPRRLLLSIFQRAVRQLAIGVVLGTLLSWSVLSMLGFEANETIGLVVAVAAITTCVGAIAAVGPARRTLRVPAAEALRGERA